MTKYGFIGTGNMAKAMIQGLLKSGVQATDILVSSPRSASKLADTWGVLALSPQALIDESNVVVLAFLPNQLTRITNELHFDQQLIISVLAGISLSELQEATHSTEIVRTLPNVNVAINQGLIAFASGQLMAPNAQLFGQFTEKLGESTDLSEDQFAIFSAIAGSGPAFVFKYIKALSQAGINNGLSEEVATNIATKTVLGSAMMLASSDATAQELEDKVASPGGSTRAGLDDLNTKNFDDVVKHAIKATMQHKHL